MPPERRTRHWKEGRSAFELGRTWTRDGYPAVPAELRRLLDSNPATKGVEIQRGITEHETALPFGRSGPRCHDLALSGTLAGGRVTACVEAKGDEPFGGTVEEELDRARKRSSSNFPQRLNWLTTSLFGLAAFEVNDIRYQLLSATGGTMLEAEKCNAAQAVLVIHEFRTTRTNDSKMEANAQALETFVGLLLRCNGLGKSPVSLECEKLLGPIRIQIRPSTADAVPFPAHLPLFIGKIRTDLLHSA